MKELIKVEKRQIGNGEINSVDARELHVFLEVQTQFSKWINRRINEYCFTQHIDFITISRNDYSPPRIDYTISIDMAKELSMVERNHKGKDARQYFISMEKQVKELPHQTPSPTWEIESEAIQRMLRSSNAPEHMIATEKYKHVLKLGGPDLRNIVGELPCSQNIKEKDVFLEPTEFGLEYGLSGHKFNKLLAGRGLQVKTKSGWVPTDKGKKLSIKHLWSSEGKSGYNYKWDTARTREVIR